MCFYFRGEEASSHWCVVSEGETGHGMFGSTKWGSKLVSAAIFTASIWQSFLSEILTKDSQWLSLAHGMACPLWIHICQGSILTFKATCPFRQVRLKIYLSYMKWHLSTQLYMLLSSDYWPVLSDKCHYNTTCPRSNFSKFLPVRDGRTKLKVEPCMYNLINILYITSICSSLQPFLCWIIIVFICLFQGVCESCHPALWWTQPSSWLVLSKGETSLILTPDVQYWLSHPGRVGRFLPPGGRNRIKPRFKPSRKK